MLRLIITPILFSAVIILMFSCANRKKIVYFQGNLGKTDLINIGFPILQVDDMITITVMGMDAEAVKPFNLATYGSYPGTEINPSQNQSLLPGYIIDINGEIDFPVIGKIKIAGLNRTEAAALIATKLKEYIKDPIINVRLINFRITVLGDVARPGTYTMQSERVTLIDAIGIAGDLNLTAVRKNVLIIREINGSKTETVVDMTKNEIFNSPVYYLKQNDIIYVEHNRAKKNSSVVNLSTVSVIVSLTSILITLATLTSLR